MIEDYIVFNSAKFIKDYYRRKRQVVKLQQQLDDISMLHGSPTNKEKVQSMNTESPVEVIVLRRAAIQEQIDKCNEHIEAYEEARKRLTQDETVVIDQFFSGKNPNAVIVYLEHQGISRASAYRIRNEALNKIALEVAGIGYNKRDG